MTPKQRVKFVIREGIPLALMAAMLPAACVMILSMTEMLMYYPELRAIICPLFLFVMLLAAAGTLLQWANEPD